MASARASRRLRLALLCAVALAGAAASPLGVSPRLELPPATSIGVAPRTRWVDERVAVREAVVAPAAAAPAAATAVRATLEVVVPTPSPAAAASTPTSTSAGPGGLLGDDDGPPVFVGTDDRDAVARDDAPALDDLPAPGGGGGGGGGGDGGGHTGSKVFFVDEDSDEDAIKDIKSKKKDKKTGNVPIVVSYDGWKGKTEDDIPIDPDRRRHYNFNYDMHHDYSGISSPAHFGSMTPRPLYKTVRTSDVPVTFWDVPLGSESLLVHRLLKSPPASNELYPTPIPSYWRPTYVNGGSHNQGARGPNNRYPGVYRSVVHKRPFQPTPSPSPGFYGGVHPRVYPQPPGPTSGVWCPPRSPGWSSARPVYPTSTSTTSTRPVLNVKDKLDLDDAEEDDKGEDDKGEDVKKTPPGDVKIIGKVGLDDFRK